MATQIRSTDTEIPTEALQREMEAVEAKQTNFLRLLGGFVGLGMSIAGFWHGIRTDSLLLLGGSFVACAVSSNAIPHTTLLNFVLRWRNGS